MFTAESRREMAPLHVRSPRRRARTVAVGYGLAGAGLAMIPWILVLSRWLPETKVVSGWSTAWVGLDAMEAAGLLATGVLLVRGSDRYRLGAAATAMLLVLDAWFDLTTSAHGSEQLTALAMAAGAEIPLAATLAFLALRRQPGAGATPDETPNP